MSTQDANWSTEKSPASFLAIAWLVVGVPLLFGVAQTVIKAAALFH